MGGRVVPTLVPGPPTDTLFKGLKTQPRNVAEAKRLLAKSSYKGEAIYLFTPPATDVQGLAMVSEVIQSQLKAIGINVVIENMEQDLLNGALATYVWGGGYVNDPRCAGPSLILLTRNESQIISKVRCRSRARAEGKAQGHHVGTHRHQEPDEGR